MLLLVSVRGEDEVAEALAGGADIIDAKDPARGALGPVSPATLRAIAACVPETVAFGAALGDFESPDAVRRAVAGVAISPRRTATYVKLGFAGERSEAVVTSLIAAALGAAGPGMMVVPVAYADHERAGSSAPEAVLRATLSAGARGYLIDTWAKDGRGLLDCIALNRLRTLSGAVRAAGLLLAIAGSLTPAALDRLAGLADVVGVRGAACRGGRDGRVDADLVRRLRVRLHGALPAAAEAS